MNNKPTGRCIGSAPRSSAFFENLPILVRIISFAMQVTLFAGGREGGGSWQKGRGANIDPPSDRVYQWEIIICSLCFLPAFFLRIKPVKGQPDRGFIRLPIWHFTNNIVWRSHYRNAHLGLTHARPYHLIHGNEATYWLTGTVVFFIYSY